MLEPRRPSGRQDSLRSSRPEPSGLSARAEFAERAVQQQEEFAAQIAHDLVNPLTVIKMITECTLRRISQDTPVDTVRLGDDMRAIEVAATKALGQVDRSLEVARAHGSQAPALDVAPTDIVGLVTRAVEDARPLARRHRLVVRSSRTRIIGECDGARISQALDSLLSNAIKYSPAGGAITVDIRVTTNRAGDWAVISVADEGLGIPRHELTRIFERFYRAENTAGLPGTGLGLSAVKQIVEAHGGTVQVRSVEGQGSVFTIRVPLSAAIITTCGASPARDGNALSFDEERVDVMRKSRRIAPAPIRA